MTHLVEQAFDTTNLYEILKVPKDCSPAQLRKAYYKQAKVYHPDKNDSDESKLKFQAISWSYHHLKDPTKRSEYDRDGILPQQDEEVDEEGTAQWKEYFDSIFGKVTTNDIDNFAMKYKMSEEEEKDVLANYEKFRGDLMKMLEYVMLSEERDAFRWMEDYIRPAIASGKIKDYSEKSENVLEKIQKRLDKEKNKTMETEDPDRTDTEGSDQETESAAAPQSQQQMTKKKKEVPKKAKKTKAKGGGGGEQNDLIAAIRNKNRSGNPFAALGARYGVNMEDDDPLDDETFARLQSKMKKKKKGG